MDGDATALVVKLARRALIPIHAAGDVAVLNAIMEDVWNQGPADADAPVLGAEDNVLGDNAGQQGHDPGGVDQVGSAMCLLKRRLAVLKLLLELLLRLRSGG
jgi:hypothetical protein